MKWMTNEYKMQCWQCQFVRMQNVKNVIWPNYRLESNLAEIIMIRDLELFSISITLPHIPCGRRDVMVRSVYHERHINVECVMLPIRTSGSTSNSNDICFKFIWGWYHLISSSVLNIFANKINRIGSNKTELEEMSWLFTPTWGPWCHTLVFFTCHSTGVIPPLSFTLYCSPPFVHLINLTNSVKCQLRAIQTECQITMWMKL